MFQTKQNKEAPPAKSRPGNAFFQTKLRVNQPGDSFEQEADRVADRVVQNGSAPGQAGLVSALSGGLQRKCAECEQEEKGMVQRSQKAGVNSAGQSAPPIVDHALAEGGRAIEADTRQSMENSFGYDFSGVRIHDSAVAGQSASAISARAYTSGSDIVFAPGEYQPETTAGKRLLAHELTHVVQQQSKPTPAVQRDDPKPTPTPLDSVRDAISKKEWSTACSVLSSESIKSMLDIVGALSKTEAEDLRANLSFVYAMWALSNPWSVLLLMRVFMAITTVCVAKHVTDLKTAKPILDMAKAAQAYLLFAERVDVVEWLKPFKKTSKAGADLLDYLSKPLLGYTASGLDFSNRFFQHADKLGFKVEDPSLNAYATDPYSTSTQPGSVTDPAQKSFEKSDILFFSGHQYAQYKQPGVFTNDDSDSCFNIGMLSNDNKKVKMVVSTSCATICKDTAAIWKKKFPGAMILGYQYSAPSNGGVVADAFANNLVKQGPIDLSSADGQGKVRKAWKAVVMGSVTGGPGILFNDKVEIHTGGKWKEVAWNDKANECHYH